MPQDTVRIRVHCGYYPLTLHAPGYTNFYANVSTYKSLFEPAPKSWALIPALRHALTLHPQATHLFSLTPRAFITNFTLSLTEQILNRERLESLMIRDIPVVPPDSVIHTFSHLTPSQTNLILTQDVDNLAHTSLLLRNDEWSHYLLDAWFDPLYRSYNFQKAELHALEHIVQWHPTILAKLVLVPQRTMNSYNIRIESTENPDAAKDEGLYQDGDFLVVLKGCADTEERDCEKEMQPYWDTWSSRIKPTS
jgi:mannan polymerase II complex MNN11 subunit